MTYITVRERIARTCRDGTTTGILFEERSQYSRKQPEGRVSYTAIAAL